MKKCIIVLFTFCCLSIQAQEAFPTETGPFFSQFSDFMLKYKSPAVEEQLATFEAAFKALPPAGKQKTIAQLSDMKVKGMSSKPYFVEYLDALLASAKTEQTLLVFQKGVDIELERLKTKNFNNYNTYLKFFQSFAEYKALRYSAGSISWFVDYKNIDIISKEDKTFLQLAGDKLTGIRRKDSISIVDFAGEFDIEDNVFVGTKGTASWEKLGQPEAKAFLDAYSIEPQKSQYKATKAVLQYPSLFGDQKIDGQFEDNISNTKSYPRFISSVNTIKLNELGSGVQYLGGLSLYGTSIKGSGTEGRLAQIRIVDQNTGKLFFKANGLEFNINQGENVSSSEVDLAFYFDQDSITHQSLGFQFDIQTKILKLARGETPSQQAPFFNSLHQVYIDVDKIEWRVGGDSILIGKNDGPFDNKIKKTVSFASKNNFDAKVFSRMQGAADYNPLTILKVMSEKENTRKHDALLVAKRFNPRFNGLSSAKTIFYELVKEGFIFFDEEKEEVIVTDKLIHYGKSAQGKIDFDFLNIKSNSSQTNALLNIKSKKVSIIDASNIELSKKQRVGISPMGKELVLDQGRGIDFDGKLFAGFSTFTGKKFKFNYDEYLLNLDTINYLDLFKPTGSYDENGEKMAESLASRIQGAKGVLYIDDPANKSGRESYPEYPKFESQQTSYVTYDEKYIQNGAYHKDSFYFQLTPFLIESLDSFNINELAFDGELESASIFAPIREKLIAMEDNSLGFIHKTAGFYDAYRAKGKFKGELTLNLNGLTAIGEIGYLGSSILSQDIIFKPREMNCSSEKFFLSGTSERAEASGENVKIAWFPFKDNMAVTALEEPFEIFKSKDYKLAGTLNVSPSILYGTGELVWDRATLTSDSIALYSNSFEADTASININNLTGEGVAIETKNVSANFDLSKQFGEVFSNNEEGIEINMPANQYITIMDGFEWNLASEEITYKSRDKLSKFISIHPDQDSLTFYGEEAKYDLAKSIVNVTGVESITCSDSEIFLPTKQVNINPEAVLDSFKNVKMIANLKSKNHLIEKANIMVLGRRKLTGSGVYNYDLPNKKQGLVMDNLEGKPTGKGKYEEKDDAIRGSATVTEADNFFIDEVFNFDGQINLDSRNPGLYYEGFVKIQAPQLKTNWFAVGFDSQKDNLFIDYKTPKGREGTLYHCGIYTSKEFSIGYPNLFTQKLFRKDRALIETAGKIHYDRKSKLVHFGDSIRMVDQRAIGSIISYDIQKDIVYADGLLNLASGLDGMRATSAGSVKVVKSDRPADDYIDDSYTGSNFKTTLNTMMAIQVELPDKLLRIMKSDFVASANPSNYAGEHYQKYMPFFVKNTEGTLLPDLRKGKPLKNFTFFLANLPLLWDQQYRSYASPTGTADLISIDGDILHKKIKAYFEIKMPSSEEDKLVFLLEGTSQYWYYFSLKQNEVYVASSNPAFMSTLEKMKSKELKINSKLGKPYNIMAEEVSRGNAFKSRVKGFKG